MQARSTIFYVRVHDLDRYSADDLIDIISVPISNLMPGRSTGKKKITGEYGNGRITLSFQLECWDHFYGRNCDVYCRPTNDSRGHFTCGLNGEIVCLMGWQDPANHCLTRKDVLFTTKFSLCQAVCSKSYRMC